MAIQAQLYSENLGFPLGGSQDWIDNGCSFNELFFNLPQNQQIMKQQQQQQQIFNLQQNSFLLPNHYRNIDHSMAFSAEIESQKMEIDRFITLQNERLRMTLQEQRKQQLGLLLRKYETNAHFIMKQKDEEIGKAMRRTMELEELLRRKEIENQTWQRLAIENESQVESLRKKIENLKQQRRNGCFGNGVVEDAESCCDVLVVMNNNREEEEEETGENRGCEYEQEQEQEQENNDEEERRRRKKKKKKKKMMICKSCNSRSSCVVFLPCRHLSSCKACEAFLDCCPICGITKKANILALL